MLFRINVCIKKIKTRPLGSHFSVGPQNSASHTPALRALAA